MCVKNNHMCAKNNHMCAKNNLGAQLTFLKKNFRIVFVRFLCCHVCCVQHPNTPLGRKRVLKHSNAFKITLFEKQKITVFEKPTVITVITVNRNYCNGP